MVSLTGWTWVWAISRTGEPGLLQSMGLQRVGPNWATELNWSLWSMHLLKAPPPNFVTLTLCFPGGSENPPAMWEIWVQSLGWEDALERGMAPHSSILALRSPWTEEPRKLWSIGLQRVGHDWMTFTFHLGNTNIQTITDPQRPFQKGMAVAF